MNTIYVVKHITSKKYLSEDGTWTRDLFKAAKFEQSHVSMYAKYANKRSDKDMSIGKRRRFVAVKLVQA